MVYGSDEFRRQQCAAMRLARMTGEPCCLVETSPGSCRICIEQAVIAQGSSDIDAILWSTDCCASDGIDPELLA